MTRVKICGIGNVDDARVAVEAGADALGFVFAPSPREVSPGVALEIRRSLPPFVDTIGVFVDADAERVHEIVDHVGLSGVQLHGTEPPAACRTLGLPVIKRFPVSEEDTPETLRARLAAYEVDSYLLDPGAGSGRTFPWEIARSLAGPVIVAGGLTPDNVGQAVAQARPFAVDVASGVESEPGRKDPDKVRAFLRAVRMEDVTSLA